MRCLADRGASPDPAAFGAHGIAAQERHVVFAEDFTQALDKARVGIAQHMRRQHAEGPCTLGCQIGQVHCDELPCNVGKVLVRADVDALDQRVVGEDQLLVADIQNCGIILETACGGGVRQRLERGDERAFVQRPASVATASRMPLTNFASRSSKNALATSTYSLIELALGTSCRAISS